MSDEYASSGYEGTLANPTVRDITPDPPFQERGVQAGKPARQTDQDRDYTTQNYPAERDTTSQGGYGASANVWSDRAQRGNATGVGSHNDQQRQEPKDEKRGDGPYWDGRTEKTFKPEAGRSGAARVDDLESPPRSTGSVDDVNMKVKVKEIGGGPAALGV
ncbi:hypothetical protein LshimejAT787_1800920 [Lyophyllum shimeji]|uniref:Uncharacterized protein n=1 Tax=Lyophyllum shimeji TaxID=47721 RepID=A0A9P3UUH7_LYOSH|nr:hypothetical protein LshimejAT787_1800920 [Lyophyllum shimeji]